MHIYTIFNGKDGLYYDQVGDELFVVKSLGLQYSVALSMMVPVYEIDHGDERQVGVIKDHGYNVFLGSV
jgi:hypothetical protein